MRGGYGGPLVLLPLLAASLLFSSLSLTPSEASALGDARRGLALQQRRRLQDGVMPASNLVSNPGFEGPGSTPAGWNSEGNVSLIAAPVFDGQQAILLGYCAVCNPKLQQNEAQFPLNGAVTVQFPVNPSRWHRLYFYAAALGDPTVPQTAQVTINRGTQDAATLNFTLVPGAAALAVPGSDGSMGTGSDAFQMLSGLFRLDVNVASLRFSSANQGSIVIDQVTVLEEKDPVGVVPGNFFAIAQPGCFLSCPAPLLLLSGGASVTDQQTGSAADGTLQQVISLANSSNSVGAAFYSAPLSLLTPSSSSSSSCSSYSFTATFSFKAVAVPGAQPDAAGASPAPGLAFVITADPVVGAGGSMMGYGRVCGSTTGRRSRFTKGPIVAGAQNRLCRPSLAVEFDSELDAPLRDVSANHVGLDAAFNPISLSSADLGATLGGFSVADGAWHTVSVAYNASERSLSVSSLAGPILEVPSFDLCSLAAPNPFPGSQGLAPLYVGFTGAAGTSTFQITNATLQVLDNPTTGDLSLPSGAGSALENLVANPGFESWLPQADRTLSPGDAGDIHGWAITSGRAWVLQAPPSPPPSTPGITCQAAPFEGAAALALGGCPSVLCSGPSMGTSAPQACSEDHGGKGVVVQQVNGTVPGQDYMVYLSVWAPPQGNASSLTLQVAGATQTFALAPSSSPSGAQLSYVSVSLKFTATGASTKLTITGSAPSAALVIDAVSVVAVAPASAAQTVSLFTLSNFSSAAFQDAGAASADGTKRKIDEFQATRSSAAGVQVAGGGGGYAPDSMFVLGGAGVTGDSAAMALNAPQPFSSGLALFPVPVSLLNGTDATGAPGCGALSFAVDFAFQAATSGQSPASPTGGFALVVLQDPVPGSSASNSLGFTRACATAGACGAGIAVGFPGVPSCNGAAAGDASFRPGVTFLSSLAPVDNLSSTVCTGTPDPASVDPTITYGGTVVYEATSQTLSAWLTKGSTTGGADISQAPVLQQGSVDLCALLSPGALPGAAPTGSFYLGFTSTSGDCSADPASCTAYRALSMGFSNAIPTVPTLPPGATAYPPPVIAAPPPPPGGGGGGGSGDVQGWIIGLAAGAVFLLAVIFAAFWCFLCRRRQTRAAGSDVLSDSSKGAALSGAPFSVSSVRKMSLTEVSRATKAFHASRQLGTPGAYGPVFKGQSVSGQQWAVKRYKLGPGVPAAGFAGFEEEVTRLADLGNPGVVPILGYLAAPEIPEYMVVYRNDNQESLFECLHKRKEPVLNLVQRVRIMVNLSDTLAMLHSSSPPLVHRNVKPTNIMLTREGLPLLTDVCFARSVGQPGPSSPGSKEGPEGTPTMPGNAGTPEGGSAGASEGTPSVFFDPSTGVTLLSPVKEETHSGPLEGTPRRARTPLSEVGEQTPLKEGMESGTPKARPASPSPILPGIILSVNDMDPSTPSAKRGSVALQSGSPMGAQGAAAGAGAAAGTPAGSGALPPFVPRRAAREGYIDPEVVSGANSSSHPKADVFSFGVVMLELLTGRLAVMPDPDDPSTNLVITDWAVHYIETGEVELIADPRIYNTDRAEPLLRLGQIAVSCVRTPSSQRPDMGEVAKVLHQLWQRYFDGTSLPPSTNTSAGGHAIDVPDQ